MQILKMLVILIVVSLPTAVALNFDLSCPTEFQEGTVFTCDLKIAASPGTPIGEGLKGMSFTVNTGTATNTVQITASSILDVSDSSGNYGFTKMNSPYLGASSSLAMIIITPVDQNPIPIQVNLVKVIVGPNNVIYDANDGSTADNMNVNIPAPIVSLATPGAPPSCSEIWTCTDWSACSSGQQTRTCTDEKACGTTTNKPSESRTCTSPLPTPAAVCADGASASGCTCNGRVDGANNCHDKTTLITSIQSALDNPSATSRQTIVVIARLLRTYFR